MLILLLALLPVLVLRSSESWLVHQVAQRRAFRSLPCIPHSARSYEDPGCFHFAFYPIFLLHVFFYLSLCLVLLIPTDPTNTLLVTGIFFHLFVGVFISFCIFSSRLGIPTDCGVVSTFAILTPVPPPTTSANSPDSRPNLSHLSHFLSQILLVSLSIADFICLTFFLESLIISLSMLILCYSTFFIGLFL